MVVEVSYAQDCKSENTNFREKYTNFAKIKDYILCCTTSCYKEAMYKIYGKCKKTSNWSKYLEQYFGRKNVELIVKSWTMSNWPKM